MRKKRKIYREWQYEEFASDSSVFLSTVFFSQSPCSESHPTFVGRSLDLLWAVLSQLRLMCYLTPPFVCMHAAAKSLQSCLTLCYPIDGSPPGSPVPGILQARTLEWVAISFSNAWKRKVKVKLLSRVWLSNPTDCSLPGSSVHGIFQARVLEWGAIAAC